MAVAEVKPRFGAFDLTLPSTALAAREVRVYTADSVTLSAASDIFIGASGSDGDDMTAVVGRTVVAGTPWTIPVDRRQIGMAGYFKILVWSATSSLAVDGIAEPAS